MPGQQESNFPSQLLFIISVDLVTSQGSQPAMRHGKVWLRMTGHPFLLHLFADLLLAALREACHGRNAVH